MPVSSLFTTARRAGVALAAAALAHTACADPSDAVFVPYGEEGVRIVQATLGAESLRGGGSEQAQALAIGGSPTARWSTAVYAAWYREPGERNEFSAVSWLNHWSLVQRGATAPADLGMYLEIERPREHDEGYEITWGPTLQWDTAHVAVTANAWLRKSVRAQAAEPAALIYQWQTLSLWRPHLQWGLQGFGDLGPWRHWNAANQQEHSLGPALFAKWPGSGSHEWALDTAVLAGLSSASPRATWRLRGQYRF